MSSPPIGQRLMQYFSAARFISDARRLEIYPPFFLMRIKVLEVSDDWRHIRIRLPLNSFSRNPGGVMFGGYQAALADPIAAVSCARVFPGYSVWTRAMCIDFERGGSTDLELRFDFPDGVGNAGSSRVADIQSRDPDFRVWLSSCRWQSLHSDPQHGCNPAKGIP